jgi:cytoskeleton protein RodZ
MIDLGSELKQAREAKGISLAEAEAATRIRERYLKAMEANDWAALPTQVQARGFLRNYAAFLGLDGDTILSRFGQATMRAGIALPPPPASGSAVRTADREGAVFQPRDIDIEGRLAGLPAWLSSDILIGVALALVVAIIGFGLLHFLSGNSDETSVVPTATLSLAPTLTSGAPQPTTGGETSSSESTSAVVTPTFDASTGSVQLTLEATEHVWVRVTVDGDRVLEGILAPGTPETWQGTQQITLETANGAGLGAVVNGQPLGPLGERGETLVLAWGPGGPLSPVPTSSP